MVVDLSKWMYSRWGFSSHGLEKESCVGWAQVCKPEPRPPMRSLRDPEPLKDIGGKMLISKLQPPQSWI